MMTLLKILTFPIWLPFKLLWFASKVVAFCFLLAVLVAAVYVAIHVL